MQWSGKWLGKWSGRTLVGLAVAIGGIAAPGVWSTGAGAAADGQHWVQVADPASVPQESILRAVSCSGPVKCTAVGTTGTNAAGPPLIVRYNGKSLSRETGVGGDGTYLEGVSCPTATFCMAVGSGTSAGVAEVWRGSAWTSVSLPNGGSGEYLSAVSCASSVACTAVGSNDGKPLAFSYAGGAFKSVSAQKVSSSSSLSGVSCSGTFCLAVGDWSNVSGTSSGALIERSTGSGFTSVAAPKLAAGEAGDLHAVECLDATYCAAVGEQDSSTAYSTLAEIYNAGAVRVKSTPDPTDVKAFPYNALYGVTCVSETDCWAAGQGGDFSFGGPGLTSKNRSTITANWNGTKWSVAPSVNPGNQPTGLLDASCKAKQCLAVGGTLGPNARAVVEQLTS